MTVNGTLRVQLVVWLAAISLFATILASPPISAQTAESSDGSDIDGGVCVALVVGDTVEVGWSAFNGEDNDYQVRAADAFRESVPADGELLFVDRSPVSGSSYVVISREGGVTESIECSVEENSGLDPVSYTHLRAHETLR